ncbi:Uncharacterised protein [Enterobacter hormaechei]|nr:Uncharacterised protein [Enterobacter hormaechei]
MRSWLISLSLRTGFSLMQGDFSNEIMMVNEFRKYLQSNNWQVVQLVCSGGQAHLSISYKDNGKNKTVFPDVIAIRDKMILVGEIKGRYNYSDELKLIEIKNSSLAQERLIKNIAMRFGLDKNELYAEFALINSSFDPVQSSSLYQFVFEGEIFVLIHPNGNIGHEFSDVFV